jgi:glycosyltransferase involved in cell wall biosynthesis
MLFTVVVTVCEKDQVFLPRALTCLLNQSFRDFETVVVVDGEERLSPYDPAALCEKTVPARVVYRPRSRTTGFRERNHSLGLARGDYVAWLSADNLAYPNWLQNHRDNLAEVPGAVSVVNIQYWQRQDYWGVLPRALAYGWLDLLNYTLPAGLARRANVFGPDAENVPHADWIAFERCSREAPVVWHRDQPVCACHF